MEWLINKADGVMQPAGSVRYDVPAIRRATDEEEPTSSLCFESIDYDCAVLA